MSVPKPPFHSATEELLYNIYLKLPEIGSLTTNDINTISKLNAILLDGPLLTQSELTNRVNQLSGNVPEAANTLEKLYTIIQGLGNLKAQDIDTLAEINAVLTDADLVSTVDLVTAVGGILDNVAIEGNTLKKLYALLGTKQDMFGQAFPKTLFVSPIGNDATALPGDFSKPYTLTGMLAVVSAGDTVSFLPGAYVINFNIARSGVAYTTFAGKVVITVNHVNATLYDFNALSTGADAVTIAGDFDYILSAEHGCIFDFRNDNYNASYCIRWSTAWQHSGIFMKMPVAVSTGIFEGNVEMEAGSTLPAFQCRSNAQTIGAGMLNVQINNKSLVADAIRPWFAGFTFRVSYQGSVKGLFSQPLNQGSTSNEYVLNLKQGPAAETVLTSGNYSLTCEGGIVTVINGARASIKANLNNCRFNARPATNVSLDALAKNVVIENDQVDILVLDGLWDACEYNITSTSLCVMKGRFRDWQFNQSAGILKIEGYVRLKNGTWITVGGDNILEISGKVLGKAPQVLLLNYAQNLEISGRIKQLEPSLPAIKSAGGGYVHHITLKGAVIEAGQFSGMSIQNESPDGLHLKFFGTNASNRPVSTGDEIFLLIGSWSDYVVDNSVGVIDV